MLPNPSAPHQYYYLLLVSHIRLQTVPPQRHKHQTFELASPFENILDLDIQRCPSLKC
ncbi:hypothetical protein HanXRQr2_Chr10g0457231 [Helianthus annuus]|uniref:Uncharacterized protein n=1 Tax=Helianthus annuus TaxID=4232 RepID=A0A9K3I0Q9_HELAN|nr:hypothetical protein HanXRQr2_Chr10g0457231 [Helianthus annuus]